MPLVDVAMVQRIDGQLAVLDRLWSVEKREYLPEGQVETEEIGYAIRYLHLFFRKMMRMSPLPELLTGRAGAISGVVDELDRIWTGDEYAGHYAASEQMDELVRILHVALRFMRGSAFNLVGM